MKINIPIPLLDEMIQDFVSKHLVGGELKCHLLLETGEEFGLSRLEMLHINKLSQDDKTGIIYYTLEGDNHEYDFSDLTYNKKIYILDQLREK